MCAAAKMALLESNDVLSVLLAGMQVPESIRMLCMADELADAFNLFG